MKAIDFTNKDFQERIKKLLKFLNKHCDTYGTSDYVSSGDVAMFIEGDLDKKNQKMKFK